MGGAWGVGGAWGEHADLVTGLPSRGDTIVGHDVWIGGNATITPGLRIGHGVIVATGTIVTRDVPDYAIVGGNPATLIRQRYDAEDVPVLLSLAWWDWPMAAITEHLRTIADGSVADLRAAAAAVNT